MNHNEQCSMITLRNRCGMETLGVKGNKHAKVDGWKGHDASTTKKNFKQLKKSKTGRSSFPHGIKQKLVIQF